MRCRCKAVVLAAALATVACASRPPAPSPRVEKPTAWTSDAASGDVVLTASGYRFAALQKGCERGEVHEFDASGDNVSVAYDCPSLLWLTIYVYANSYGGVPNPPDHFRGVVGDVLAAHAGATVERAVELPLPLGTRTIPGFTAFLSWPEPKGEIGSFLMLIPDGARFVKVRVSFPLDGSDRPIEDALLLADAVLRAVAKAP